VTPYEILLKRSAERELTALPRGTHDRIVERIARLRLPRGHPASSSSKGRTRIGCASVTIAFCTSSTTIDGWRR